MLYIKYVQFVIFAPAGLHFKSLLKLRACFLFFLLLLLFFKNIYKYVNTQRNTFKIVGIAGGVGVAVVVGDGVGGVAAAAVGVAPS